MKNHTLLIVDDDELNLDILSEILGDHYSLIQARNGREAIEQITANDISLVLMDIMMPEMNGYEACRKIKSGSLGIDPIPNIILVSAKASTSERVKGYEVGADDYIIKPFEQDELLAKVRVQVRLRDALDDLAAARAALAMDNQELEGVIQRKNQEITDTRDLLVFAMAKLADSRDPETGEHLERIREYCRVLAEYLSKSGGPYAHMIDAQFINNIYLSSPLHDIGKVGIPDAILLKPGRLTDEEFSIMKQHAAIGSTALETVASYSQGGEFLKMAMDIARHHHEKWNGSGYPDGLRDEQIPLAARICGVADVFDALTSVRVYKSAFSPSVARSMIVEDSGKHFDPVVVGAFEACFEQLLEVRRSHQEAHQHAGE